MTHYRSTMNVTNQVLSRLRASLWTSSGTEDKAAQAFVPCTLPPRTGNRELKAGGLKSPSSIPILAA